MMLTLKEYYENQIVYVVMPALNRNQTVDGLLAQHL